MLNHFMLGSEGIRYVLACLSQGGELSQYVQSLVSSANGLCFSPIPEQVSLERALQFETGDLMPSRVRLDWIEKRMLSFCERCNNDLLVFEDQVLRRSDNGVSEIPSDMFFFNDEVYFYVECKTASGRKIETALREVRSFQSISFLISMNSGRNLKRGSSVDSTVLHEMARGISEIFVSAYDQEGVVVWSRT